MKKMTKAKSGGRTGAKSTAKTAKKAAPSRAAASKGGKTTAAKKTSAKTSPVKKTAAKKSVVKKTVAKKTVAKKSVARTAPAKKTAKKTAARGATASKQAAPVKKTAKKTAPPTRQAAKAGQSTATGRGATATRGVGGGRRGTSPAVTANVNPSRAGASDRARAAGSETAMGSSPDRAPVRNVGSTRPDPLKEKMGSNDRGRQPNRVGAAPVRDVPTTPSRDTRAGGRSGTGETPIAPPTASPRGLREHSLDERAALRAGDEILRAAGEAVNDGDNDRSPGNNNEREIPVTDVRDIDDMDDIGTDGTLHIEPTDDGRHAVMPAGDDDARPGRDDDSGSIEDRGEDDMDSNTD